MKKGIGIYGIIWALCLALFNVVAFVTQSNLYGDDKFGSSFWVGYVFITVAFLAQLACTALSLKDGSLKKLFYKLPLVSISYVGLVSMLVVGSVFMAVPVLPEWIGIILCLIIIGVNAISVIKATVAATVVEDIDKKVATQTFFMKSLTIDAEGLVSSASSDELRTLAKQVYEAIRYSDPMSNEALADADSKIQSDFCSFSNAVRASDLETASTAAKALVESVEARNRKCKLFK